MFEGFGDVVLFYILVFSLIIWRMKKIAKQFDKDGVITGAARNATAKGVTNMIGRWLR